MMAVALKLLRHKATWGVGVAIGVLFAVWGNGALKYREGNAAGVAQEKAAWQSEVALARASALSSQVAADAAMSALRDSLREANRRIAQLSEARALAEGKYAQALRFYRQERALSADTTITLVRTACDELADSCELAMQAAAVERMALTDKLRLAEALSTTQDSTIRTEPVRVTSAIRDALATQRATQRQPSRTKWALVGAGVGALSTWLVLR